jgi:hypothetical protein
MYATHILKGLAMDTSSMEPELEGKPIAREPVNDEESTDVRAKTLSYALLNRPSPPY